MKLNVIEAIQLKALRMIDIDSPGQINGTEEAELALKQLYRARYIDGRFAGADDGFSLLNPVVTDPGRNYMYTLEQRS